ncbi:hypothetical protein [Agrobacterium cavarae]|uniref:hypothetical protein n=1 Tax=Agrobacterium cavarae TaxID=2528239 RepID=UPI0028AD2888|nr:hypothetical protein [Agrobacterium cavarae]
MLDKIGHIKNPLTVVALFAALAEVSGTVVLPMLQAETQAIYVWFLMAFPILLVGIFFATLNWNHTVLYAPSDFNDEQIWRGLVKATRAQIVMKSSEEAVTFDGGSISINTVVEPLEKGNGESTAHKNINKEEDDVEAVATAPMGDASVSTSETPKPVRARKTLRTLQRTVIDMLERELGDRFERFVSPINLPNIVFDGVSVGKNKEITALEIKYTPFPRFDKRMASKSLQNFNEYYNVLSPSLRRSYSCLFAVIVDGRRIQRTYHIIQSQLREMTAELPFPVVTRVIFADELNEEWPLQ